jgi:NAD(P)-dependent dehydrogenase (short-subunit alcohol dehydrogenase family)
MSRRIEREALTLITGAAQGIGEATARHFAGLGAQLALNDRQPSPALESLCRELSATPVVADITRREEVRAAVTALTTQRGPIGTLVCNAASMTMAPFLEHDVTDWWKSIDTNIAGTLRTIQEVLPSMRSLGGGRIVVVCSYWGLTGWPDASAYAASKAGLISLVKTLGRELAPEGIIVNGIAPGVTATPQLEVDAHAAGVSLAEMHRTYAAGIPLGRIARPDEIASGIAFLADRRIGAMIGTVLNVNGGEVRARA